MANIIGKRIGGNLVYVDRAAHDMRVVGVRTDDIVKFEFNPWTMGVQAEVEQELIHMPLQPQ